MLVIHGRNGKTITVVGSKLVLGADFSSQFSVSICF